MLGQSIVNFKCWDPCVEIGETNKPPMNVMNGAVDGNVAKWQQKNCPFVMFLREKSLKRP